jgi:ABC-2 type transport system permease protein
MLRVALRANVWTGAGFSLLTGLYVAFLVLAYASLGGDRAGIARDLGALAPGFSFIIALPQRLDTNAGYLAWFGYGQIVAIYAFWGILAGTFASRGEEERGLTDLWLAAGVTRPRVLVSHLIAFAAASAIALAVGGGVGVGLAAAQSEPIPASAIALQSLGVLAITVAFFALGLVNGQLVPTRRGALGLSALALVFLFLLNGFSRQWDALSTVRWISPFAYYDRIHGLYPDVPFGTGHLAVVLGLAVVGIVVALAAFGGRDIGATLGRRGMPGPPRYAPSRNPLLRSQVLTAIYDQRTAILIWCLALAWEGFFITRLAHPFLTALAAADPSDPSAEQLRTITGAGHGAPYEGFIGFEWFGTLAGLAVAAYAITQVARWSGDDTEGRLEMLLSAPVSRTRIVLERAAALFLVVLVFVGVAHSTIALGTLVAGERLDAGRMAIASAMLIPVAGVFGGLGAAASAWRPRLTVGLLSAFAIASFFIPFAKPVVRGPDWFGHLSVFDLYGTPLTDGFEAWRLAVLAGLTLLGSGLALVAMLRRDVGR